ncbi:MAG: hypothetical protein ACI8YO_002223 [Gammaproteobacteria bacterium]|jgi:hypothetical protein
MFRNFVVIFVVFIAISFKKLNMKFNILFTFLVLTLAFTSCKKEVDDPITISSSEVFKMAIDLNFGGDAFVLNDEYINATNYRVSFSNLKFYLGDISLIKSDGTKELLSEIELYSVLDNNMSKNFTVPVGTYTGLEYSWGVPESLGGTDNPEFDPVVYGPDHPLNLNNSMYWTWNAGYRYSVVEGRYNIDANGTDPLINTFSYHAGTQTLYRTTVLDLPISLDGESSTTLNIDFDLSKLFFNDTETLDCDDPAENGLAGMNANTLGLKYIELFVGAVDHSLE